MLVCELWSLLEFIWISLECDSNLNLKFKFELCFYMV
jgi:hypothetical protein